MNTPDTSQVVTIEIILLELNDQGNERLLSNTLEITNPTAEQFFFRYDQLTDTDLSIKRPLNKSHYISVKKLAQAKSETVAELLRLAMEQKIPTYYFSAQDQHLPAIFFDSPLNITHTVEGCRHFEIKNRSLAKLFEYFTAAAKRDPQLHTQATTAFNHRPDLSEGLQAKKPRVKGRGSRAATDATVERRLTRAREVITRLHGLPEFNPLVRGEKINSTRLAHAVVLADEDLDEDLGNDERLNVAKKTLAALYSKKKHNQDLKSHWKSVKEGSGKRKFSHSKSRT